ncbi:melibiose:sodium transporter MelB [Candidatus Enterococcus ferrettii]|uniref:Melibiose permease n=1 Tax=Candidatus Enterococcus ferrettii TaxID=2815324 RepID=A0ABV0EX11_9ENTE|nr:melibiose:sodium transporter MelB [Enterococcus sp. 665A]MBO1340865.1 melibiose:sodium transporter MelB [Enterococcus sp. 665A]
MKVSAKEKYSYGLGALGKDMIVALIFVFAMLYFTDVLKISASFVGSLFFLAKFWDAINDLAMGVIVDNTRTKFGKFRPWLVIGTLLNAIVFVCLFTNWGLSGTALYVFAAVMYILWGMTYTVMDIPYWSMLPNLTSDKREREKLSVIPRIFASIGGSLIVAGFGLQIIDFLGSGDMQSGFTRFAWVIAIVFIVTIGITVLNVKSADKAVSKTAEKVSVKQLMKIILKNDQLVVAIGIILTFNLAIQFVNGVSTYYFIYVTGSKMMFSVFTMFAGFAEIGGLFLFPELVGKISRAKVYLLACLSPVVGFVLLLITGYVAPENVFLTAAAGILVKLGSGLQLGTATVILADVVDYGEYKFGTRNESVTFSIQTLMIKFSSAIGALLTGFALDLTGYVPNAVQSPATLMGIRIVMIVLPIGFTLISYLIYKKFFRLSGEFYDEFMAILTKRKAETIEKEDLLPEENREMLEKLPADI